MAALGFRIDARRVTAARVLRLLNYRPMARPPELAATFFICLSDNFRNANHNRASYPDSPYANNGDYIMLRRSFLMSLAALGLSSAGVQARTVASRDFRTAALMTGGFALMSSQIAFNQTANPDLIKFAN